MTTLIEQANALHARLTTLGKVPEDFFQSDPCEGEAYWWDGHNPIDDAHALAILRDAARRVCDEHGIRLDNDGGSPVYEAIDKYAGLKDYIVHPSENLAYEPCLVKCMDWIIEQEADRG